MRFWVFRVQLSIVVHQNTLFSAQKRQATRQVFFVFFSRARGDTPGSRRITDVRIKGNYSISTTTILNKVKLRPGDVFEESALNKELKRLYATGYFADVFVETEERPEGVVVIFTVVEKPVIGAIEFKGNKKLKAGRLVKKLTIKEGDLLDFNILAQDVGAIRNFYVEQGYSNVEVDYKIKTDKATGEATVIFQINDSLTDIKEALKKGSYYSGFYRGRRF